jgi:hypothetical protein
MYTPKLVQNLTGWLPKNAVLLLETFLSLPSLHPYIRDGEVLLPLHGRQFEKMCAVLLVLCRYSWVGRQEVTGRGVFFGDFFLSRQECAVGRGEL